MNARLKLNRNSLQEQFENYEHYNTDIRDFANLEEIINQYSSDINLIILAAAQPSHDWAAKEPHTDFSVNAVGTLNLLELTRQYCPDATFIFTSTNKVYGELLFNCVRKIKSPTTIIVIINYV